MIYLPAGFDYVTFVANLSTIGIVMVEVGLIFLIIALLIKVAGKAKLSL